MPREGYASRELAGPLQERDSELHALQASARDAGRAAEPPPLQPMGSPSQNKELDAVQSELTQLKEMVASLGAAQLLGADSVRDVSHGGPSGFPPVAPVSGPGNTAEYAKHKPGDIHDIFQNNLEKVAVKKRGDPTFATTGSCWNKLLRMYPVAERIQHQLLGYAFAGTATRVLLNVTGDVRNCTPTLDGICAKMATKLYNDNMAEAQRRKFNSAVLLKDETL